MFKAPSEAEGNEPIENGSIEHKTLQLDDGGLVNVIVSGLIPYCTECGIENGETNTIVIMGDYYPDDVMVSCKRCGGTISEFDPSEEDELDFYEECPECGDDENDCECEFLDDEI